MACWVDMHSWVSATFSDVTPDNVAKLAVAGMDVLLGEIGGGRLTRRVTVTDKFFTLPAPDGFRVNQVHSLVADGCVIDPVGVPIGSMCKPQFDAYDGNVELLNFESFPARIAVEYGLRVNAGDVGCHVDDELFSLYAPVLAEWIMSRLEAGRSHRSARRMSTDRMREFHRGVARLKRDISRTGTGRQINLEAAYV